MTYIKCPKCGREEPAFDYAHVCGPVQVKKSFSKLLRQFEQESKLEIYGLGARREMWEAALEKYAELVVEECTTVIEKTLYKNIGWNTSRAVRRHFGIDQVDE